MEVTVSFAVMAVGGGLLVQLLQAVAQQQRLLQQHAVAMQTAANLLEVELAQPGAAAGEPRHVALSAEVENLLYDAQATVIARDLAATQEQPPGQQITVQLRWGDSTAAREEVLLVGWKFSSRKDTP